MKQPRELLEDLISRYPALNNCKDDIWMAYELLKRAYERGGKLLIAGNGGSAADAEHIVGELMKGFEKKRAIPETFAQRMTDVDEEIAKKLVPHLQGALPAIALVNHVSLSTAFANDVNPVMGFAQQLYGYGRETDVFLAITTSGNSENVLYACAVAKAKGMKILALSGGDGGKVRKYADVLVTVPEKECYKIQELHLPIYHAWCLMLETAFFDDPS